MMIVKMMTELLARGKDDMGGMAKMIRAQFMGQMIAIPSQLFRQINTLSFPQFISQ